MQAFLPFAVLSLALIAAPAPDPDKPKTDKENIEGVWTIVTVEQDGVELKDGALFDNVKDMKLTFKGDAVTNSKHPEDKATFTIDATKKPPTMDLIVKGSSDEVRESMLMLYELKDDTLKLCAVMAKDKRPTEMTSKNGQLLLILKREAAKPPK